MNLSGRCIHNCAILALFLSSLFITEGLGSDSFGQYDNGAGKTGNSENFSKRNLFVDTLKSIKAPGRGDSRGLTWDGACLWFAENDSKLMFKIDTATGAVLDSFPLPGLSYTQDLAWDGKNIWHAEYSGKAYKIDPDNGAYLDTISTPVNSPTGLTWDGTYLWTASYSSDSLYQFSHLDGTLIKGFDAPGSLAWGLAKAKNIWNCNVDSGNIFEIDPTDGSVLSNYILHEDSHLTGFTFDGTHLWIVDDSDDKIKKLDIPVATKIDNGSSNGIIIKHELMQNFPNPFNSKTAIGYQLTKSSHVELNVYNNAGQKVCTLVNCIQSAGNYVVHFNAMDLTAGIYYYSIRVERFMKVRKMVVTK